MAIDRRTVETMASLETANLVNGTSRLRIGVAALAILLLGLSACDTLKEQAGLTKKVPDEFTVIAKAPLIMPPDFSLRPPRPGARRPQEVEPREVARSALLSGGRSGKATAAQAQEAGRNVLAGAAGKDRKGKLAGAEMTLLRKAGALDADPSIRQLVNRETSVLMEKDASFADRLLFWQPKVPFGSAVDAGKEAQRLREAAAAGEDTDKIKTPVIKRRKRGLLEGIF
mgnify:CR=1 FL=1|jgi:hypothetical protein